MMEEEVKKEGTDQKQEETAEKPLDKMTATELREFALEKKLEGLTGVHAMKKEELLKGIKEALGIQEEEPAKKSKRAPKKEVNVKDLKQKIDQLKEQKQEAVSSADKKKAKILRRRINRLKKQTKRTAKA
jgi:protein-arginine kinase activator protein McsA